MLFPRHFHQHHLSHHTAPLHQYGRGRFATPRTRWKPSLHLKLKALHL